MVNKALHLTILILLSIFVFIKPAASEAACIVEGGQSDYAIVISEGAVECVRYAADELATYIDKATGAKLSIRNMQDVSGDQQAIYIGRNQQTEFLYNELDGMQPESFAIGVRDGNVYLVGNADTAGDPLHLDGTGEMAKTASLFAVYEFLQRFFDIQWLYPGPVGENVPRRENLIVPETTIFEEPSFVRRILYHYGQYNKPESRLSHETFMKWCRRNKLGMGITGFNHHNWNWIVPKRKYFEEHPEYFALNEGKRGGMRNKLCCSNEDVRDIAVRRAEDYFDENNVDLYSLSPTDGRGFCECSDCQDAGNLTDTILEFYEAISGRIANRHPKKYHGGYIYADYRALPENRGAYRLSGRFIATYVINNSYNLPASQWEDEFALMRKWNNELPNIRGWVFYSFPFASAGRLELVRPPFTTPEFVGKLLGFLYDQNYMGVKITDWCHWQMPIDYYIMARLLWDAEQDVDELKDEYLDGMYGEAADDVRRYYRIVDRHYGKGTEKQKPLKDFWPLECTDVLKTAASQSGGIHKKRVKRLAGDFKTSMSHYLNLLEMVTTTEPVRLPEEWLFKTDPDNEGEKQGWYRPDLPEDNWSEISTHQAWEHQGYDDYDGHAWYRCSIELPDGEKADTCVLHVGAVDDTCTAYVNGVKVKREPAAGSQAGTKARRYDVCGEVKPGEENVIAIRVHDEGGFGGIWRPCFLIFEQ